MYATQCRGDHNGNRASSYQVLVSEQSLAAISWHEGLLVYTLASGECGVNLRWLPHILSPDEKGS